MTTMSPGTKSLLSLFHFCRSWSKGKYSFVHLFQKKSHIYWTCFHLLLLYNSDFSNSPGANTGLPFIWRRWFGESGSKSLGSSDSLVIGAIFQNGLNFTQHSMNPSSSKVCWCKMELKILLTSIAFWILLLFHELSTSFNSLSGPTKFVPLSDHMWVTCPCLQINLRRELMHESVSKEIWLPDELPDLPCK